MIDRVSPIDGLVGRGKQLDIVGDIELRNVTYALIERGGKPRRCHNPKFFFSSRRFSYPSRPDQVILKNFSLTIKAGQKIAFVGASGSGKSTIVALIERFYDPQEGQVLIDGVNVKVALLALCT